MKLSFLTLTIFLAGMLFFHADFVAAQYRVSGTIRDQESGEPLLSATVLAISVKDTTDQHDVSSTEGGRFMLRLEHTGYYKFRINYVGYSPYQKIVRITQQETDLGAISLQSDPRLLDEVTVTGSAIGVEQYGDTTAFRASSFKTNPDASAEDLVRKLPGISVDGSTVKAQGENVRRVLVDGREFFGDDPSATLKNLPADIVDKIEVFDRLSDQAQYTGIDDGNTSKTINIVTRSETRNGQFGRFYGGLGNDNHYLIGGNWNYFQDAKRLSILGMSNNVNVQNFSSEDLVGVASSGGRGRGGMRGGMGGGMGGYGGQIGNFLGQESGGVNTMSSFGVNYSDEPTKKLKLSASYFFNHQTNETRQQLEREYLLNGDTSQYYAENSSSATVNNNHRLSLRLEYNLNENDLLIYSPRVSLQQNRYSSRAASSTQDQTGAMLNDQVTSNDRQADAYMISNDLLFRHNFEKRGRAVSFAIRQNSMKNTADNHQYSLTKYGNAPADTLNQTGDNVTDSEGISGNLTFSEGIGDRSQLSISEEVGYTRNTADKKTYDLEGEKPPAFNPQFSNVFRSDYLTSTSTLGYSLRRNSGLFFRAMLAYEYAQLKNDQQYPVEDQIKRSFSNILPGFFGRWRISDQSNLRFFYRTSTDAPSVTQLQNVPDNTNPLQVSVGNPDLKPSYSQRFSVNYSRTSTSTSNSLFGYINFMTINRYITNETILARDEDLVVDDIVIRSGGQLSRPVNLNGYWSANSLLTYSLPVSLIKSNVSFSGGLSVNRQPGKINQALNYSTTYATSGGIGVGSNISENVDFNLNYSADWSNVTNTIQEEANDRYFTQKFGAGLNLILFKGWVIRQDLLYTAYSGLADGYNQSFTKWNAGVARKFLKDNQAELSFNVYDLLNQNQQITRTVTETYIEDLNATILKRYFMVTLTYRLRDFQSSPPPDHPMPFGRPDFRRRGDH